MPHSLICRPDLGGIVLGRRLRSVKHSERHVFCQCRHLHPNPRLALRIPLFDFVRQAVEIFVEEGYVAMVGALDVIIGESPDFRAKPHEHRKAGQRLAVRKRVDVRIKRQCKHL